MSEVINQETIETEKVISKEEIIEQINKLKKEKNAVILAHNYQEMEVQEIADFVGDSLELAQKAAKTDSELIVFCGVKFMAETAKILSPQAKVLLSHPNAGCPMADMITGEQVKLFRDEYPNPVVMCYVNSSVEVKAESDICCTSSNAVKIARSIPEDQVILFVPDQNLGTFTAQKTKKHIIVWNGFCNVHHHKITVEDVQKARKEYPNHTIIIHPESRPEVFAMADMVGSTKQMADYVKDNDNVVIGTETGLYYQLKAKYPEKNLAMLSENAVCVNMKKTTLNDVLETLSEEKNEIIIEKNIAAKALKSVQKMLELS